MRRLLALAFVCSLVATTASAQLRGVEPADFYKEIGVSDVAVAPDGRLVAFTVTTVVEAENRRHREVWMAPLANGRPSGEPFRFTDPTEDSHGPRWSPDGSVVSFTSKRGKDPNTTWFARVAAPGGEAYHVDGVAGAPVWSPDGRWIAFTKAPRDDEEDEDRPEGSGRRANRDGWIAPDAVTTTLDATRFDGRVVTSMRLKRDGTLSFLPHPSTRPKTQLFVVAATGGEAVQLTSLPFDVGNPVWSADGRLVFFGGDPAQDDERSVEPTADLFVVSRDGGEPRRLTPGPGAERAAAISRDGRRLAFLFNEGRGTPTDLMVVDLAADGAFAGAPRNLTARWDLVPGTPRWTPDDAIRFTAEVGGDVHLFEVALDGAPRQVTSGERQLASVSTTDDGRLLAYAATDVRTPAEVFVARADGSAEARVSSFNDAWLAGVHREPVERVTWRVADGSTVEGWLMKPVGYQPGTKYPLVLKIHGGPHGAYGNTYFRTFHVLSNAGFFVLYPNPRGSSGYGHSFMYATRGRWGEMDQEDFLTGVDTVLARYPDIDPTRLGVSGGSYGGFMTNWLTSRTNRFAAAVTSRSITNWESWYGTSDAQGLTEYEFHGTPWEQRETYRRLSPISYVEHVTAPTLIIHSENDYRTPIADGEQWFMALKKRGVPVEMVRYPRSSHGLSRTGEPWLLVDRLERIRSWFAHYLGDRPAPTTAGTSAIRP